MFQCSNCERQYIKPEGRCVCTDQWGTIVQAPDPVPSQPAKNIEFQNIVPQELSAIDANNASRMETTMPEMDRVLGGGLVAGSVILLGGEPGIGKSTLLLQIAHTIAQKGGVVLYVAGEESGDQIKIHARRLAISGKGIMVLETTQLESALHAANSSQPDLMIIDSIQTLHASRLDSGYGTIAQTRECTQLLTANAKQRNLTTILAGHVTKDGDLAGPRLLEHMVDVVLSLEGDRTSKGRVVRSLKNRFGSTNEIGIFTMESTGFTSVNDPSQSVLEHRPDRQVGSVLVPIIEGNRPILTEIQALTTRTNAQTPRRSSTGVDFGRTLLITSVISQRLGLALHNIDVIINATGGFRINETAADLGIALAIISSQKDLPLPSSIAVLGEVGLSGELRPVPRIDSRLSEIDRLGIATVLVPFSSQQSHIQSKTLNVIPCKTLQEAITQAFI
jgi:DNA repair protein RadA/Sms